MNDIQVTARFKIHENKLDEFMELADACIFAARRDDKGTIQYDWFFSEDRSECIVRERYVNAGSLLHHFINQGDLMGLLLKRSDLSLEVYGELTDELIEAAENLDITFYSFYTGLVNNRNERK